ncbi:MAG: LPS export ABC transporter periplasmic protein LptC [Desulfuromonadales bacterium]|nr:LPS export ABC transporter periplasmic protein LptC [Desulfuromonadales bacterium]
MKKIFSARFLLAGFILLLGLLLVLIVVSNLRTPEMAAVSQLLGSDDDLAIQQLNYTETRGGVRKWSVQAQSATHDMKQERAQLKQLTLTFYDPTSSDLILTSATGELDLKKREVLLRGDVVIQAATGEAIYTDELLFVDAEKVVRTDHPVRFVADSYTVSGRGMRFNITNRTIVLLHQVEAVYKEGLDF